MGGVVVGVMPRVEVYLDDGAYVMLLQYKSKERHSTNSRALKDILNKYLHQAARQDQAVENLNRVIQGYEDQIRELKHQLRRNEVHQNDIIKTAEKPAKNK